MLDMPDPAHAWDHENAFYLTAHPWRFSKFLAHYELFKMSQGLPGAIVECGVFKGTSLVRWASFRHLFGTDFGTEIIGFDSFSTFPSTDYGPDQRHRERFIREAGPDSVSTGQLEEVLGRHGIGGHVRLVAGDIRETVPDYVNGHPELRIRLLNIDVDVYEPTAVSLAHLLPRVVPGGIVILDDYAEFPGETKAVDEYLPGVRLERFPWAPSPTFFRKDS